MSDPQPTLNAAPPLEAPPSQRKRALLAAVLSLFFSGMGQLYNRHPRKAVFFAVVTHLFGQLSAHTGLLLAFRSMVAFFLTQLIWKVFVIVDAARSVNKRSESPVALPRLTYSVLVVVVIVATVFPSMTTVKEKSGFAAFKVPSRSMCPTICVDDRIVVDTNAYRSRDPQRGDVIAMKHPSSEGPFLKRVIGLPGDTVAPGPNATVTIVGAIIAIAGVSWIGIKQYRTRLEQRRHAIDCEHRNAEFARRVDTLKRDAQERLKVATKKTAVSQCFKEHGIPFTVADSEASGILYTIGGCAPLGCGTNRVGIRVRVSVDADATVTGEPAVDYMYVDCV